MLLKTIAGPQFAPPYHQMQADVARTCPYSQDRERRILKLRMHKTVGAGIQ